MIGASVAYHLAARGVRDVVVLERAARPGMGSTGRATGGFRVQFANAIDVQLSLRSLAKLHAFADETGGDCGYEPAGYLWLASSEVERSTLRAALAVQRENGVTNAREVSVDDLLALNPAIDAVGIIGGTFCPTDGFIRPLQILDGYQHAAQRLGARFLYDHEVIGFENDARGRIAYACTQRERFATDTVVNAAGAWAAQIAHLAGETLPVTPLRRQVALTVPTDVLPTSMPMTITVGNGFHARVRDGRVLALVPTPGAADPFDDSVEDAWIEQVGALARRLLPVLADVALERSACWGGLYECSPDGRAIVGAASAVPNLYFVNGSSGHGVMHAPILGALVSDLIVDGAPSFNIDALAPTRFAHAASGIRPLL